MNSLKQQMEQKRNQTEWDGADILQPAEDEEGLRAENGKKDVFVKR
jgi:hypothetical protein